MSDSPAAATNVPVFTVSELSNRLKRAVEDAFGRVQVRGEISGFKRAASGHLYMALKDSDAVMDAVCWRGTAGRMRFQPEDGLEVVCTGKLTTYAARSKYQLVIEHMEPAGVGALMALLEERRKQLAAEGLFDNERKRDLPYLPGVVGVVTSPTGAVIRDILHRLSDRFPRHVLLWPVLVQGERAAEQVVAAIEGFNRLAPDGAVPRPDVLIVARGGGSIEDLWGFNEEIVVRAAAASDIPLISAVGHETDTTLIDLAADRRAPTPTAAAEIAVPVRADLVVTVLDLQRRIAGAWSRRLEGWRQAVTGAERGLRDPRDMVAARAQRLDDLGERLSAGLRVGVEQRSGRYRAAAAGLRPGTLRRQIEHGGRDVTRLADNLRRVGRRLLDDYRRRLEAQTKLLRTLSYQGVLERGFAVVRQAGAPVMSAGAVTAGAMLDIEFRDGHVAATAGTADTPAKPPRKPKAKQKKPDGGTQGSLL